MAHGARAAHVRAMERRRFFELLGGTLAASCGPAPRGHSTSAAPPRRRPIRAIAFDLFTLFDPRAVDGRVREVLGAESPLAATWKTRLFEYSWIRAASHQYADFERLVQDSLVYAASAHGVTLEPGVRRRLESAFTELPPWPDAAGVLRGFVQRGLRLAPLANFTPRMIDSLLARAGWTDVFEARISADRARTYKPDPRAYALAEATFRLPRDQIAFAAFGGWDAAGARWFGFPTFWVNRLGVAPEALSAPDASGPSLVELAGWVESRQDLVARE